MSYHRSDKKAFPTKLFQISDVKTQQRYILKEEVNNSKKELCSFVDILHKQLRTSIQASIVYRIHYQAQS